MKRHRLHRFFKKITQIILLLFLLLPITYNLSPITCSYAAVPHLINYQGRLTDSGGTPLDGAYTLTFKIYDAETAGNLLWQGTYSGVNIEEGIFGALLGDVSDPGYNFSGLAFDKTYWLEIKVGDEVMSPRQKITSAGYAIRTETAENALQAQNANTVANVGLSAVPAANKILPLDNNAKFPSSVLGLKVYDSGWFPITTNSVYTKTHNLGTTKVIVSVYISDNSNGSGWCTLADVNMLPDLPCGVTVVKLSTTQIKIRAGYPFIMYHLGDGVSVYNPTSGYTRIVILALE